MLLFVIFQTLFKHLGELLLTMITLDEIIYNGTVLQEHWKKYKRWVFYMNSGYF